MTQGPVGPKRVVLAEDHAGVKELVRRLIDEEQDLEVVGQAATGDEVLDLAASLHPDVIVLDLGLPGVDGEVALPQLRSQLPATTIVVLSGQASAIIEPRLRGLGADVLVEKGVTGWEARLLEAVRAPD